MGSGCKPDGFAYGGSNPSRPTMVNSVATELTTSETRGYEYGGHG
jgi:hypothetical protein